MHLLYEDRDIVVCVKPVGVESEKELPALLARQLGGEIYPLHRLDMNVGGVMVFARNKAAASKLSAQIARGEMIKEYVAFVKGTPEESGTWEDFLFKDSRKNKVFVVKKERAGVKKAKLAYRVLEKGEASLVHIRLFTGRSHQIRVQFASRGFPLLGDHKYGARDENKAPMLFSCRITFIHKGKEVTFSALPDFAGGITLEELSWEQN
jgi:23S rRNA pseudouridine1911/1915/1917 synthase